MIALGSTEVKGGRQVNADSRVARQTAHLVHPCPGEAWTLIPVWLVMLVIVLVGMMPAFWTFHLAGVLSGDEVITWAAWGGGGALVLIGLLAIVDGGGSRYEQGFDASRDRRDLFAMWRLRRRLRRALEDAGGLPAAPTGYRWEVVRGWVDEPDAYGRTRTPIAQLVLHSNTTAGRFTAPICQERELEREGRPSPARIAEQLLSAADGLTKRLARDTPSD